MKHTSIWPKAFKYFDQVRLFLVLLCTTLSILVFSFFLILINRTDEMMLHRLHDQAVAYVDLLNHAKSWNLNYGGVYVEKRDAVETNFYLKGLDIKTDLRSEGGRTLTMRNHAIMTTEISRISELKEGVRFRVVSNKPIDPDNSPDPLESSALASFEQGKTEHYALITDKQHPIYRYVRPLFVETGCLECHQHKGYRVGDIIGAISVIIPIGQLIAETSAIKTLLMLGGGIMIALIVGIAYFLTWQMAIRLDEVQKRLKKQASTDELTGLKNRRTIMNRLDEELQRALRLHEPLGVMILDIDDFKRINDTYGHPSGDRVLSSVAACIRENLRSYDLIGRIGGEEFLVLSPGTGLDDALILAERIRESVKRNEVIEEGKSVSVTISIGLTISQSGDATHEKLLKRADSALYRAKDGGRNRVVSIV